MEQVDVEDGLGQVYHQQSHTFTILSQGQDAVRFFLVVIDITT